MAFSIDVAPNTDVWGISLLAQFDTIEGTFTIIRVTPAGTSTVRGLVDVPVLADHAGVDIETPLNLDTHYILAQTLDDDSVNLATSPTLDAGWADGFPLFILRDLFRGQTGIMTNFTYGPIADNDTNYRGGKFPVIGRPDPVIVIDVKQSEASQMTLITKTVSATKEIRAITKAAHPLVLQSPPEYLLGMLGEGVLYFFPDKTSEQHVYPDGRQSARRFVVDYTEIARPSSAVTFMPPGTTWDEVKNQYATWGELTNTGLSWVDLAYGPVFGYL